MKKRPSTFVFVSATLLACGGTVEPATSPDQGLDPTPLSRQEDALDAEAGFDGMLSRGGGRPPGGFFVGWTPGRMTRPNPDGLAWLLDGAGGVRIGEAHPCTREAIDVRRRNLAAVDAEIGVTEVIGDDQDDVGTRGRCLGLRNLRGRRGRLRLVLPLSANSAASAV